MKEGRWEAFAEDIYNLRNQLQKTLIDNQGLLPKEIINKGLRAVKQIDAFRDEAEEEMFRRGGPQSTKIWYRGGVNNEDL